MIRRNIAIAADFPVADMHTVYEWCMIYTDRLPGVAAMDATAEAQRERLQYLGAIGSNAVLVTADTSIMIADTTGRRVTPGRRTEKVDISLHYRISNAVYQELAKDIETGKLKPERPVYLDDRPNELDPTLCVIGAAPILAIAERWGDGGERIQKLLAERHERAKLSADGGAPIEAPAPGSSGEPPVPATATASEAPPSGVRTNRAAAAEEACRQLLVKLVALNERPANTDAAFQSAKTEVAKVGPLSQKAFDRTWRVTVPDAWKKAGRRRRS
jgi:hypothetical protein